jgi:hypothetical protein
MILARRGPIPLASDSGRRVEQGTEVDPLAARRRRRRRGSPPSVLTPSRPFVATRRTAHAHQIAHRGPAGNQGPAGRPARAAALRIQATPGSLWPAPREWGALPRSPGRPLAPPARPAPCGRLLCFSGSFTAAAMFDS